jgi:hypothetical protein
MKHAEHLFCLLTLQFDDSPMPHFDGAPLRLTAARLRSIPE